MPTGPSKGKGGPDAVGLATPVGLEVGAGLSLIAVVAGRRQDGYQEPADHQPEKIAFHAVVAPFLAGSSVCLHPRLKAGASIRPTCPSLRGWGRECNPVRQDPTGPARSDHLRLHGAGPLGPQPDDGVPSTSSQRLSAARPVTRTSRSRPGARKRTSKDCATSPSSKRSSPSFRSALTSTRCSGLGKEKAAREASRTSSWMGSHAFCPTKSMAGAKGRMESPRTNSGMRSSGTSRSCQVGRPRDCSLVQKSYQRPGGR